MILAVLFSPFLAIYAQKRIDQAHERHGAKLAIFKDLMGSRRAPLSLVHVQALNRIDLEFTGTNHVEAEVRKIWREYLDHLSSLPSEPIERAQRLQSWIDKGQDYLADLLVAMGQCLGYSFDRVHIKKGIYSPQGHEKEFAENQAFRAWLIELLQGKRALPTMIVPQNFELARETQTNLLNVLNGSQSLRVSFKSDEDPPSA